MGEGDEVGQLVERQLRDGEDLVAGERAPLLEQSDLGLTEGPRSCGHGPSD